MRGVHALAALALLALAASAAAQLGSQPGSRVDLVRFERPDLVVADGSFPVTVELVNKQDSPARVYLLAALYDLRPGEGPCGPQTDSRFRGFTHLLQPDLDVPAGSRFVYPQGPLPWRNVVNSSLLTGPDEKDYEMCIFAATNGQAGTLDYYDFAALPLSVRPVNGAPSAELTFSPQAPNATHPVSFVGRGSDPEGDALRFSWDFGYYGAKGRAKAEGPEVVHRFYPEGKYLVTLTVSDGFASTTRTAEVTVLPESVPAVVTVQAPTSEGGSNKLPSPGALVGLAAAGAVALARRRRTA